MLSKKVASLVPYVAGEQPQGGFIKLNTNENPYPPSPLVQKVLAEFSAERLRLYPDPECHKLKAAIAAYEGVAPHNIFVGNGSDEVLGFAFLALFEQSVSFCDVTYSFYPVYSDLYGLQKRVVPLCDDFTMNLDALFASGIGGVVLANPNAPTSIGHDAQQILEKTRTAAYNVLVDEAYIDFASGKTKSLACVAATLSNLLVVKTFSKSYALAGLRCGYAVGCRELIEGLERVKNCFNSYTLDAICQKAALAAVGDRAYFDARVAEIVACRQEVTTQLRAAGHTVLDSDANFLFVRHATLDGRTVYERLKTQGILVRHFAAPRTAPFVRVTVGTLEQTQQFCTAFLSL